MKVYMYAFDRKGFQLPSSPSVLSNGTEIHFLEYKAEERLDSADGLIIPSGVFESFQAHSVPYGGPWVDVQCDEDFLLTRFREVMNLIDKKKWVCCLVDAIADSVPRDRSTVSCADTDLVKRILNLLDIRRFTLPTGLVADTKYDEFHKFLKRWGIAKTVLELPRQLKDHRVLATADRRVVGLEAVSQIIVLPFHTTTKNEAELLELGQVVVEGVNSYLLKRAAQVPEWVDEFRFDQEIAARKKYDDNLKAAGSAQAEILGFREYKAVLVRSGDALRDTVRALLQGFFGLCCSTKDSGKEDIAILNEKGEVLSVVEVKGTKGGVKREYVNQIDSHRDRQGLLPSLPGVLVVNDFMEIVGFDERRRKPVDPDHVRRARNSNVLIVRTTDLMLLMKVAENAEHRDQLLMNAVESGGGMLVVSDDGSFEVDPGPED